MAIYSFYSLLLTIQQLREYIVSKGGSYAGCFEKRDLVETAEKCTGKLFREFQLRQKLVIFYTNCYIKMFKITFYRKRKFKVLKKLVSRNKA